MWFAACNKHTNMLFFTQAYDLTKVVITICDPIWEQNWQKYSACKKFFRWLSLLLSSSVICQSALILFISVVKSTRSTQRAQTSLAVADHDSHMAHCKNFEPWWWKTTPPPPSPLPTKKRFRPLPAPRSGYATTIIMGFFLLIYSS